MDKKTALIILDGWGIGAKDDSDGVHLAKTPFFDHLMENHPNAQLKTFGKHELASLSMIHSTEMSSDDN